MMRLSVKLLQTNVVRLKDVRYSMLPTLTQVALHLNNSRHRILIRTSANFNSNNNLPNNLSNNNSLSSNPSNNLLNNLGGSFLLNPNNSLLSNPDSNLPSNQVSFKHSFPRISSLLKIPNNLLPNNNSNSLHLRNQL